MSLHGFPHPAPVIHLAFPLALCLLLIAVAAHGPDTLHAQGPETVTIAGSAVNGTAGGAVPADLPVTLHAIDGVAGRVATYDATTDGEGVFAFEGVSPLPGGSYVLVMDFAGMRYSSLLEGGDISGPAELEVFDTTDDLAVVEIQRHAMIIADIDRANREISVLEVLSLQNSSDRDAAAGTDQHHQSRRHQLSAILAARGSNGT